MQIIKSKVKPAATTSADFGYNAKALWFTVTLFGFSFFSVWAYTRWTLLQKRVVHTKFDIYFV